MQPRVYNAQTLCELLHISFRLEAKLKEHAQSVTHNGMLRKHVMYGGGELGVDYLISDYNVLILNDGLRSVKKNKTKNFFCLYRFSFSI